MCLATRRNQGGEIQVGSNQHRSLLASQVQDLPIGGGWGKELCNPKDLVASVSKGADSKRRDVQVGQIAQRVLAPFRGW